MSQRKTSGVPVRLDDLLREGAGTVWGTNLALRIGVSPLRTGAPAPGTLLSRIRLQIDGAGGGEITLCCSVTLARRVAGLLFGGTPSSAPVAHIVAAMSTLAGHVGEYIRPALPLGCSLSAPAIAVWTDASARPVGGDVWGSAVFECALELLHVQVRGDAVAAPAGGARKRIHPAAARQVASSTTNRAP